MATPSRRERNATETRQRIVDVATSLFIAQGFDATTVEQIAAEADVSPRTYFRYFPTKEALLFHDFDERLDGIREHIERRPAGERPYDMLVAVMVDMIDEFETTPEQRALMARLLAERPSVRSYQRTTLAEHAEREVTGALARKAGRAEDDLGIRAMVAAVAACFDVAVQDWGRDQLDGDFEARFRSTLAACAGDFGPFA